MKKYYLKSLLWAVLALCCADVWAADVDASAAQAAASAFIQSQSSGKFQAAASSTLRLAHAEPSAVRSNAVDYYVFNTAESGDEGVFIIVAGDDRAKQILAYGEGRMDVQTLPSNAKWWLEQYKQQIEWLQTHSSATESSLDPKRAATDGVTVEPMLTCTWSQMAPYYDQCPDDEYGRCVTGCVATAMAQVMYYWHFPAELPELTGYESSYFGNYNITVDPLPATVLDWEHMLDSYSRNYSAEEGAAVATLMRYCGQACFMQYSSEGSSSTGMSQLMAFRTFGYNKQARFVARDGYDKEQWVTMLADELLAGRPVPYCGRGDGGGHAFVVDGCKDGKFHMNWGWGGVSDGYYEIDAFVSSSFDFRFGHDMNVGICPSNDDMPAPETTYDFEVDGIYYLKNGTEATVTYRDESLDSYSGDIEVPEWVEWEGVNYRVTSVGDLAFSYSPSLTSLRLPHIKNIGNNIIDGCVGLKELYMGRELESIKASTWYSCPLLHWIDVEDASSWASLDLNYGSPHIYGLGLHCQGEPVTDVVIKSGSKIGGYALASLQSLEHLTLEDGAISVGDYAFYGCRNLRDVTIGDGVESLGVASFYECENLERLTFNGSMGSIKGSAFYGLTSLKEITMPTSIDTIGYAAFAYCDGFSTMTLHDVGLMDEFAFFGCEGLRELTLLGRVDTVSYNAFSLCPALQWVDVCDLNTWCNIKFGTALSNPLYYARHLRVAGTEVERLQLPEGLTGIGENAFIRCLGFTSVSIPVSLRTIGASAFSDCRDLNLVDVADLNSWCGIEFDDIEANPLSLAHNLSVAGTPVEELVLPEGLTSIGRYAFYGASGLTAVSVPSSLRSVGLLAFQNCTGLTRVNAADLSSWCGINFDSKEGNPLYMAHHLNVGENEVTALVIPDDVEAIGKCAFVGCEGITSIKGGKGLTSVGPEAFYMCNKLEQVALGDNVKSIGEKAFSTCTSLTNVKLGSGLENIGIRAFTSCLAITDIACKAVTPPVVANKNAFTSSTLKNATVSVPRSALEAYQSADVWNQFKHIVGAQLDHVIGDVNLDGEVTVGDVNALLGALSTGEVDEVCDVNGDGEVSIADVNSVLDIIMAQ